LEVNRPDRQARRRRGKSDPVDAEAAARAVLAGQATAIPKAGDHLVEMVRCLRVARASAAKARTQAVNALRALVVTAPAELRELLRELPVGRLARTAARLRPGPILTTTAATKLALRQLGQRYQALDAGLAMVDAELDRFTALAAPGLRRLCGIGPEIAGALLVAAGDNPERLHSEAAFAMLCGASPIPASSGKTVRHRLNRGGNRSPHDPDSTGYRKGWATSEAASASVERRCGTRWGSNTRYCAPAKRHQGAGRGTPPPSRGRLGAPRPRPPRPQCAHRLDSMPNPNYDVFKTLGRRG
jgi:transposase